MKCATASAFSLVLPSLLVADDKDTDLPTNLEPYFFEIAPNYQVKTLASGLLVPGEVAINPFDNSIYFVNHNAIKIDQGPAERVWLAKVYRFKDGKTELIFTGGRTFGGSLGGHDVRPHSKMAIKSKNEIFSWGDYYREEGLVVHNLETGENKLLKAYKLDEAKRPVHMKNYHLAIHPLNNELYLATFESLNPRVDLFDFETKSLVEWLDFSDHKELDITQKAFCFDLHGNLHFIGCNDFGKYVITTISANKKIVQSKVNLSEAVGADGVFSVGHMVFNPVSKNLVVEGRFFWEIKGFGWPKKYRFNTVVIEVNPKSGKVYSPILTLKGERIAINYTSPIIGGLAVDEKGCMYFTSSEQTYMFGRLVQLSKK